MCFILLVGLSHMNIISIAKIHIKRISKKGTKYYKRVVYGLSIF